MLKKEDLCRIGYFTKPHGIKGEIGLTTEYDVFGDSEDPFLICEMEGILVPFFLETYRNKTATTLLVKLETIDSEDAVRRFSHREVYYPIQALREEEQTDTAAAGWSAYLHYTVSDKACGLLGKITSIDETTLNTLLCIDCRENELLIPAVEEWILSVNHDTKHLELSLPNGLLDL